MEYNKGTKSRFMHKREVDICRVDIIGKWEKKWKHFKIVIITSDGKKNITFLHHTKKNVVLNELRI